MRKHIFKLTVMVLILGLVVVTFANQRAMGVFVEEGAEVHIITGCAIAAQEKSGAHIGVSEFYVRKGGRLTYTMIHNWGEQVDVRARSRGVVEEGGVFTSNYILLRPVKSLQMYPTIDLNGQSVL